MEFTEVVTPSVAVPVLCVLVCAFLVFAFGFKSPAQPPSFDVFDEEGKKKRLRKVKGSKSQSNGHAVIDGDSNANNSAKPQPSPRQAAKQTVKSQSPTSTKAKPVSQNLDQSKKTKKQQASKEEEMKLKQKEEEKKLQEIQEDTAGWHTIAKKDKKQKKKDNDKPESLTDEADVKEMEVTKTEEPVQQVSPKHTALPKEKASPITKPSPVEKALPVEQASPMEQRNKKKKDKKPKKPTVEEEVKEQVEKISVAVPNTPVEPVKEVIPSVVEIEIKDAMETTVDEVHVSKKKGKSNNKKEDKREDKKMDKKEDKKIDKKETKKVDKKDSPPPDDFVIPKSALEPEVEVSTLSPSNKSDISDNTSKSPKKKKKDKSKRKEEKLELENLIPEDSQTGASGSVEASLTNTIVSSKIPPKSSSDVQSQVTQEPMVVQASTGAEAAASVQTPTFDEMGGSTENWTEAKPKSKKKKARRAD